MIGKTNIGNGSSLSFRGALLCIKALTGSTITLIKNNLIIKTLYPKDYHIFEDGTKAYWYYSVSPSNYGEWTVTATDGIYTASNIITINSNKQYKLDLWAGEIYMNGEQYQQQTGGFEVVRVMANTAPIAQASYGTTPNGVISLSVSGANHANGAVCTVNPIDLTRFSTMTVKLQSNSFGTERLYIMANSTKSGIILDGFNNNCDFYYRLTASQTGDITLDVSAANGSFYLLVGGFTAGPSYSCKISEWYLS